jgi:excisionase family DNA binding protein
MSATSTFFFHDEAARYLGVSGDTFDRRIRKHLPFYMVGKRRQWRQARRYSISSSGRTDNEGFWANAE